ncbi:hypothetical protein C7B67_28200, partial [filamentous cyanobacterium Phorm 6]
MSISDYSSVNKRRETVISALQTVSALVGELELDRNIDELDRSAKDFREQGIKILFLGEFRCGKTSLINAFLGNKILPATCLIPIPIELAYGDNYDVSIYETGQDNPHTLSRESFIEKVRLRNFEDFCSEGLDIYWKNIYSVHIECQTPLLANGIRIIEIPGFVQYLAGNRNIRKVLQYAQAVIFVLNAIKILSIEEINFIEEELGKGRLDNVFFVINRIHTVYDDAGEEGVQEVKDYTQGKLKHHFLNEKGEFDEEFYNRRVFYVNAKGALDARTSTPIDNEMLEVSGVPALEKALENFLTSDEQVALAFNTIIDTLNRVVEDACQEISTRKTHLNQCLNEADELEKKYADEQEKKHLDETESQLLEQLNIAKMAADGNAENFDTTMETKTMTTNTSANQPTEGNESGYGSIKVKSDTLASVLEDISVLIGERKHQSIHLTTGGTIDQPGLSLIADAKDIATIAKGIREGIFNVLVVGTFSAGKSTLINSLLGEKVLKAKMLPTTPIITTLVYGDSPYVTVYYKDKLEPSMLEESYFFEEFTLTENDRKNIQDKGFKDRFENVRNAQIERKYSLLKNGVKLIDSPGLEDEKNKTDIVLSYLKKCQGVIFLLNATRLLNEKEVEIINDVLGDGRLNPVFFVINFINIVEENAPDEVDEIKRFCIHSLKHRFLNEQGKFDEDFYNRRVFFVNALGACLLYTS